MSVVNALTIKGSYNGSVQSYRECLDLMGEGILGPEVQTGSVEELPEVLKRLDGGEIQGRMVLMPNWRNMGERAV